jgi:AraC-like DNA-binding protein
MQKEPQPAALLDVLDHCVIPAAGTIGEAGLLLAQPTRAHFLRHNEILPVGVSTTPRKRPGAPVPVRGANPYHETARPTARWPEEGLITAVVPVLICPVKGRVDFRFSDYSAHLPVGQFCLIPPDVPRTDDSHSHIEERGAREKCDLFWLRPHRGALECWVCHSHGAEHQDGYSGQPIYVPYPDALSHFTTLLLESEEHSGDWIKICGSLLLAMLLTLRRKIKSGQFYGSGQGETATLDGATTHHSMSFAQHYIQEHLQEPLTIERVARATYVSRTHFTTQFRAQTGQSFTEYLTHCRVERAKKLLRNTDWSVFAVATQVGVTPSHLRELFTAHVGIAPRAYRRRARAEDQETDPAKKRGSEKARMKLTTDFESGSGTVTQLAADHWRLETVSDRFGYNRYFCVRICNDGMKRRVLHLEIYPDPALGAGSHFMTHFPSHIWLGEEYGEMYWGRWRPLRHTWEDSVVFHEDHLELCVPVEAGKTLYLATNVPLRYSELTQWIERVLRLHGNAVRAESLGRSVEGRDIPILRLGTPGRPKLLALAGMHSSEHSGVFGCQGIVEYLTSRIRDARRMVNGFDIAVIPMLNPDGNVHGYSGGTAERLALNNSLDFVGAAANQPPQTHENRLLWRWLGEEFTPDFCLHFHAYLGWKRNADFPFDAIYLLEQPDALLSAPRAAQHRAIVDRLRFETPAFSAHWGITGTFTPDMFEYQLAEHRDTISILYEINAGSVGPSEQFRRGPQVLGEIGRALLDDTCTPEQKTVTHAGSKRNGVPALS